MKPYSKYRSKPTFYNGLRFHSKKECERYKQLLLLEKGGIISKLQCQTRFPISVNGYVICTYVADFTYTEKGKDRFTVEDVKSDMTRKLSTYIIKKKLLFATQRISILET